MEREQVQKIARLLLNEMEPRLDRVENFFDLEVMVQRQFKELYAETMNLHLNPTDTKDERKKKRDNRMGESRSK